MDDANAMDGQQVCYLTKVPVELLLRITYYLPTADLGNVRLTCKALERSLFHFFSHEFFRKKQFMVFTDSLQALVDISRHPALSQCLRHVIIATDRISTTDVSSRPASVSAALLAAYADHKSLLATGVLRDMLAEAFGNLPNLETVDLRDFNARNRNRDGFGTSWSSYGSTTLAAATGGPLTMDAGDGVKYTSLLFLAIIAALGTANARPQSIESVLRGRGAGLANNSFLIHDRLLPSVTPVLFNLKKLHLNFHATSKIIDSTRADYLDPVHFKKFLSLTPNLTWLRLNLDYASYQNADPLLTWLGLLPTEQPPNPSDLPPTTFEFLEQLDLGGVTVAPKTLLKLLIKFSPTLRTVSLRRVTLHDDVNLVANRYNVWAKLFTKLSKQSAMVSLRTVDITLPFQSTVDGWTGVTEFTHPKKNTRSRVYSRSDSPKFLEMAAADFQPCWPEAPANHIDSSSDSEEDSDEDMDFAELAH
ncbi:hypothetical protein B0T22DRAFT_492228 [Podospora appendiculata]|uniref:F-box domain-containing protein n=1 Tax=Podospora appendiculata TaxID=314037 RepID=A0AAE1CA95_9PEZI|nr:hypothetical protein B0T22DRAFT_492228 [Podospora appendiculata]